MLVRDRRRKETRHSCFIGPSRPSDARPGRSWRRRWQHDGEHWLYAKRRRKTRMKLMIYMRATVYYRLEPVCGYLVSFPRFFFLSPSLSLLGSRSRQPRVSFSEASYTSFLPRRRRRRTHARAYICIVHVPVSCSGFSQRVSRLYDRRYGVLYVLTRIR